MNSLETETHEPLAGGTKHTTYDVRVVGRSELTVRLNGGEGERIVVGKDSGCDLVLEDRMVSRRHFELAVVNTRHGLALRLRDLESTNGTTINGVSVAEAYVDVGASIGVGSSTLSVSRNAEAPAVTPVDANLERLWGQSPQMRRLFPLMRRLASADVPLLIQGETGTGKEVLAESLHEQSPRSTGPFIVFDCTTVHANLMEAALFGHERGAFTGATEAREGAFEAADGGTLLIDEIGDLDLPLQGKLLRAIERSEVQRVGSLRWKRLDVRVIAATRRNLDNLIQEGKFRDDLLYRIAVGRLELPPLRERRGDIPGLAHKFREELRADAGAVSEFLARHEGYAWPGNVRELKNALTRFVLLGDLVPFEAHPSAQGEDPFFQVLREALPYSEARERVISAFQLAYVEDALKRHQGNVSRAAEASGLARRYFQKLNAFRISRDSGE